MAVYGLGSIIKELRIRNSITQIDLCDGICEVSTLSKIENGHQNPAKKVAEALLQRLGLPWGIFNVSVSESEFRKHELERFINHQIASHQYDYLQELEEYRTLSDPIMPLEEQFYLLCYGIHLAVRQNSLPFANIQMYETALKKTIPSYKGIGSLKKHLFTTCELLLLHNIAIEQKKIGNYKEALTIELFLKEYYETHPIDEDEKSKHYPIIFECICGILCILEEYEQVLQYAEEGLKVCTMYNKLKTTAYLLYYQGYALCSQNQRNEGRVAIQKALTLFEVMGNQQMCTDILKDFENSFKEPFFPAATLQS